MSVPVSGGDEDPKRARRRSAAGHRSLQNRMMLVALVLLVILYGLRLWQVEFRDRPAPLKGEPAAGPVEAISGDTIRVGDEHVRIANLEAPAPGQAAKCAREAELAEQARSRLQRTVSAPDARVELIRDPVRTRDAIGRTLARVIVNGEDVALSMVEAGVARPWRGASTSWCPV